MKRLANPSQGQLIAFGVLLAGAGAVFSPPLQVGAQPSEPSTNGVGSAQASGTAQPVAANGAASSGDQITSGGKTTRAIGTITGEGTNGKIARFTGANSIGNSVISESLGRIGIGTTSPAYPLSVLSSGDAIFGSSTTGDSSGVLGETTSTGTNASGVEGTLRATSPGTGASGVRGTNLGTNNGGYGVYGSHAGTGTGVFGRSPNGNGVLGDSSSAVGVRGRHNNASGGSPGVSGETNSTDNNASGVMGTVNPTGAGNFSAGVRGVNNSTSAGFGVYGTQAGSGYGVYGSAPSGSGVVGYSNSGTGVQGNSTSGTGVAGTTTVAALPAGSFTNSSTENDNKGVAVRGLSAQGSVDLIHPSGSYYDGAGEFSGPNGVIGAASYSSGYGVFGISPGSGGYGVFSSGNAYVQGNLTITGTLAKGAGSFKIDNPLHPATEFLSHSFVESPDMMNVYNGNATTDDKGQVTVTLPKYFQSLNRDFRYQLTPIGQFCQIIVGQEIQGNHFQIKTDKPNVKVSWQVTGIRNDAYAREHRIPVEETKTGDDRGKYLYPAGFGAGSDRQIGAPHTRLAARSR